MDYFQHIIVFLLLLFRFNNIYLIIFIYSAFSITTQIKPFFLFWKNQYLAGQGMFYAQLNYLKPMSILSLKTQQVLLFLNFLKFLFCRLIFSYYSFLLCYYSFTLKNEIILHDNTTFLITTSLITSFNNHHLFPVYHSTFCSNHKKNKC